MDGLQIVRDRVESRTDALHEVLQSRYVKAFGRGKSLFEQDEPADDVFHIVHGCVAVSIIDAGGRETLVSLLLPGDIYVEHAQLHGRRATAFLPTGVAVTSRAEFERAMKFRSEAAWEYLKNVELQLERARELFVIRGRLSLVSKIAALLLWMRKYLPESERQFKGIYSEFPFTGDHIAAMLSHCREAVNRPMVELRNLGVIEYARDGCGSRILDEARLTRIAENGMT